MFRAVIILFVFLLAACETTGTGSGSSTMGQIRPVTADQLRLRHLDSVNAIRAERGAPPLQIVAGLNAAADTHARDISTQRRAWNFGSDGSSPQLRAQRAGFPGQVLGENVGETFQSDLSMLQVWLSDNESRQVILDPRATHMGFGWYQERGGKIWWVQVIARESGLQVTQR